MIQSDCFSLDDLSRLTGEPPDRLLAWREAGLLGCDEDGFRQEDIGKARLIHDMLHYGHSLEAIASAAREPHSVFRHFLDEIAADLIRATYPVAEAAEKVGIDVAVIRRLIDVAGIGEHGDRVTDEDIDFLRSARIAMEAGLPEEALAQILHVYADTMGRAAEVGARTSHFYIHQPIAESGPMTGEIMEQLEETFSRIEPLVEPALLYFHRKGMERARWEDMLMHLEEEAGLTEKPDAPGQVRRAILFTDLAGFTPLAEAMGDVRAAEVLESFAAVVRHSVRHCHGRIVKQIGDGFMIVFPECYSAVSCALELEERACEQPQFPALRSGVHWGPVLYREGDYVGSNVNIASRLAVEAGRHQILLTEEVWRRARDLEGAEFQRLGKRRLKGIANDIEVLEVRPAAGAAAARAVDPVCGMELGPGEVAAHLTLDGHEQCFCSESCLRRFVASPHSYVA